MDESTGAPVLDPVEQRVLGALMEKELTVPGSYPMTLNALRTACNQSSSRDPIVDYDDGTIIEAIDRMRPRGLARVVHASHGSRTTKYRQVLDERLSLDPAERAIVTVLLLRGAQSAGELKARTDRLHSFADRGEVESVLATLAARAVPLVVERERRAGQHDSRWVHLLGPVPDADDEAAGGRGTSAGSTPPVDLDTVLAEGAGARDAKVVAAYDEIATTYADTFLDELDERPFERWLLERIADEADGGPVADAGCGPGHIAFHLAAAGADVVGFDLTPAMVAEARRRFPDLRVEQADLTDLPVPDGSPQGWAAILAWYSLVHMAGSELPPAVALLAARLRPGGTLLVAVHAGAEVRHADELFGHEVDVDFVFHDRHRVVEAFHTAGLVDVEWYLRSPVSVTVPTERLYVHARRPTSALRPGA